MNVEPMVMALGAVGVAVVTGVAVWAVVRSRLTAEDAGRLALVLSEMRHQLGETFGEAEVEALARWAYRYFRLASELYSEEEWVALVQRWMVSGLPEPVRREMRTVLRDERRALRE